MKRGSEVLVALGALLSGLVGLVFFNVIIGVFGLRSAIAGLVLFAVAAICIWCASARRESAP